MQMLLFSSNTNANTIQKYFKYFFNTLKFYMLTYMNILNRTNTICKMYLKVVEKYLKIFFKCKYLSFENFKCKYFRKVFKMHLNANAFAFAPMSGVGLRL